MNDAPFALLHELKNRSWTLRWWRSLQFTVWCLLGVQLAMLVLLPMRDILGLTYPIYFYLYASLAGFVIGGAVGLLAPLSLDLGARILDAKYRLQERMQSALEAVQRGDTTLAVPLARDAIGSLERGRKLRSSGGGRPRGWTFLPVATAAALLLLLAPPIPVGTFSNGKTSEASRAQTEARQATAENTQSPKAAHGDGVVLSPPQVQVFATQVAFRDSAISSDPTGLLSYVRSDDRLLSEAGQEASLPQPRAKPVRIQPQEASHATTAGFQSGGLSEDEAAARMSEFEETMKQSSAAAKSKGNNLTDNQTASSPAEARSKEPSQEGEMASAQSDPRTAKQSKAEEREKGASKKATKPADDTPGTPSSEHIETPAASEAKPTFEQDMQTARFGGGQYPHNAPGAGFPDWMRGDQDPHFMDAGQGEGASTGKTSGQAGVGHAMLNKGPEKPTLELPSMQDLYLPGKLQDGDPTSYQTEVLGRGSKSKHGVEHTDVLSQYQFQAEEQMSRNRVPFAFRTQVQNYFARIQ